MDQSPAESGNDEQPKRGRRRRGRRGGQRRGENGPVEAMDSNADTDTVDEGNESPPAKEEDSHRRRPADKRSEGRRRRQRRTSESSVAEEAVTVTETASPEPATTDVATGQTLEVASSEALSAAFEATSPTNSVEAEFQVEPSAPETPVPSADVQKAAPSPVEPSDAVTDQTSAEVIGNVIGALVRDTSGMTDSGRAVNDPRISPKPITQTQIVTEQAQLFALPEGPPVSIIRQDIPRAGNDPRGPRAQMATAE